MYTPELHFKEFASSVADMKNSVQVSVLCCVCLSVSVCNCMYVCV